MNRLRAISTVALLAPLGGCAKTRPPQPVPPATATRPEAYLVPAAPDEGFRIAGGVWIIGIIDIHRHP